MRCFLKGLAAFWVSFVGIGVIAGITIACLETPGMWQCVVCCAVGVAILLSGIFALAYLVDG